MEIGIMEKLFLFLSFFFGFHFLLFPVGGFYVNRTSRLCLSTYSLPFLSYSSGCAATGVLVAGRLYFFASTSRGYTQKFCFGVRGWFAGWLASWMLGGFVVWFGVFCHSSTCILLCDGDKTKEMDTIGTRTLVFDLIP